MLEHDDMLDEVTVSELMARALQTEVRITGVPELAGGVHRNLLVDCEVGQRRQRVVIRTAPDDMGGYARHAVQAYNLAREHATLQALRNSPLEVPNVLYFDQTGKFLGRPALVMEHVPGETILQAVAREPAAADLFVDAIVRMNRLDVRNCPALIDAIGRCPTEPWPIRGLEPQISGGPDLIRKAMDAVIEHEPDGRPRPALGNGDLNPQNFILGEQGVTVVDWEWAGWNDPLLELFLLDVWPPEAPFMHRFPIAQMYCERAGLDDDLLPWYRLVSALIGWMYAFRDGRTQAARMEEDRAEAALAELHGTD